MGERDHGVAVGAHNPVNLSKDPIEIVNEAQGPDRHGEIDLIRTNERKLGWPSLVEFHGDALRGGQVPSSRELLPIAVGGDDAGTSAGEPNGGVSGPTPQIKDSLTGYVAEQAPVDLGTDTWSELDMVERSGSRCSVFVAHHACTLGRSDQNDG